MQTNHEIKVYLYADLKVSFSILFCGRVKCIELKTRDNVKVNICEGVHIPQGKVCFLWSWAKLGFGTVVNFTDLSIEMVTTSWGCS